MIYYTVTIKCDGCEREYYTNNFADNSWSMFQQLKNIGWNINTTEGTAICHKCIKLQEEKNAKPVTPQDDSDNPQS